MAYLFVGLDRGTCVTKAVILDRSFRGNEVRGTRIIKVPQDGSAPPTQEAVHAAVAQLVEEFAPGSVGYITNFSGNQASTWFLPLPFSDQKRIDQTLPFELENYVPFDLEDMVLDYRVVHSEGGKSRVLAALASKTVVGDTLQQLKKLKVDPSRLVLDAYALAYVPPGKDSVDYTIAVIDLGHTQTVLTVRSKGAVDFIRSVPTGGLRITQALMSHFGVNYPTAEEIKVRMAPVDPLPDDVFDPALLPAVEKVGGEAGEVEPEVGEDLETMPADRLDAAEPGILEASRPYGGFGDVTVELEGHGAGYPEVDSIKASAYPGETIRSLADLPDVEDDDTTIGVRNRIEGMMDGGLDLSPADPGSSFFGAMVAEGVQNLEAPAKEVPGFPQQSEEEIRWVVWEAMRPIMREIRNALLAYEGTQHRDIEAVLLVGGGALLKGLPEALSDELGISVGLPSRYGPDQMTLSPKDEAVRYAKAFGLAYMGTTHAKLGDIDFRRGEFSYKKSYQAMRRYLFAAIALGLLGLVVWAGMFASDLGELARQSSAFDKQIESAIREGFPDLTVDVSKGIDQAVSIMQAQNATLQTRAKVLGMGDARRTAIDVLREVSLVVPESKRAASAAASTSETSGKSGEAAGVGGPLDTGEEGEAGETAETSESGEAGPEGVKVDVEDWTYEGNQVKIRGTFDKFDSIERVEKAIQSSAMVSETKSEYDSKGDKKNFNMVITLHEPGDDSAS